MDSIVCLLEKVNEIMSNSFLQLGMLGICIIFPLIYLFKNIKYLKLKAEGTANKDNQNESNNNLLIKKPSKWWLKIPVLLIFGYFILTELLNSLFQGGPVKFSNDMIIN